MSLSTNKNIMVSVGAFFLVFLLALAVFLTQGRTRLSSVIFFPEPAADGVTGEPRRVSRHETLEDNIRVLVVEMLLGPMDIRHTNMFPANTRIRSVFVRGDTAYLDFSPDIIFLESQMRLSFDELLSAVRHTVMFNFRRVSDVVITVDGQIPGSVSYIPREKEAE